jgi:PAS domain S-box-containing protein
MVPRPLGAATWEWNLETKEYRWSKEMYQIFNLSSPPSRLRSGTFLNRIHPEDRQRVVKALGNALTGAQAYNIDHRILRADGSVRLVHGEAKVWFDRHGRPVRIVGTLQLVNPGRQV